MRKRPLVRVHDLRRCATHPCLTHSPDRHVVLGVEGNLDDGGALYVALLATRRVLAADLARLVEPVRAYLALVRTHEYLQRRRRPVPEQLRKQRMRNEGTGFGRESATQNVQMQKRQWNVRQI